MRRSFTAAAAALALLSLGVAAAAAAAKPDFTGTWVLDLSQSEGLPAGFQQTVTVKHAGDKLELVIKQKSAQGERTVEEAHTLDGKAIDFKPPVPPNQPPPRNPKRTSKWTADGAGIEILDTFEVDTPDGPETIVIKRTWTLSADGKQLVVNQDQKTPIGSAQSRRVYNKQG